MTLFQNYAPPTYDTVFYSFRMMFDFHLGNYPRDGEFELPQDTHLFTSNLNGFIEWIHSELDSHIVISITEVMASKIVLGTFIVAMLMRVYDVMLAKGDFTYKSNRYEYIERYQIALRDAWGYSELITNPAPINLVLILLIPWLFNPPMFKKAADIFGKIFFWTENIGYLALFLLY